MDQSKAYMTVFEEYPDVLDVEQMSKMLSICKKTAYKLLKDNAVISIRIGREYKIPKVHLIDYLKIAM